MFRPAYQNSAPPNAAPTSSRKGEVSAIVLRALASARNIRARALRNLPFSNSSIPKALTIRFPTTVSLRMFDTSAAFSWLVRLALLSLRPKRTRGTSTRGMATRQRSDSLQEIAKTATIAIRAMKKSRTASARFVDMIFCRRLTSPMIRELSMPVGCTEKKRADWPRIFSYRAKRRSWIVRYPTHFSQYSAK